MKSEESLCGLLTSWEISGSFMVMPTARAKEVENTDPHQRLLALKLLLGEGVQTFRRPAHPWSDQTYEVISYLIPS